MTDQLNITISQTADGKSEYVQILSLDMEVNVVLIAAKIQVQDVRRNLKKVFKA